VAFAPPAAQAEPEYQVKAAIIYNIARFVEWPGGGRPTVVLCILGADPFGPAIDGLAGHPVGQGQLEVRRVTRAADLRSCQMLFVSGSEADHLKADLAEVAHTPVLTIGDTAGFAQAGVIVNLYLDQNRVRFEINIDAAQRSRLAISSQLLKLARITHDRIPADG
jgi:hypothetical protein